MWNSFKIAFSMYSKIPMPKTDWNKENMKYALCFFPLVGLAIGIVFYLWSLLAKFLVLGNIFTTAIYTIIPILITGGIHMDGFVDSMDAINSYQSIERKLEILKDSHIGAFALITSITYFIAYFGVLSEIKGEEIIIVSLGFILSRALSGLSIVTFPLAKKSGLAANFSDSAQKKKVKITMIIYIIIISLIMLYINLFLGIASIVSSLVIFFYYKSMAKKKFGGITGDIAGYFLQLCELFIALALVLVGKIFL